MKHHSTTNHNTSEALQTIYRLFDEVPFAVASLKGPSLVIEYINQYNLTIWQLERQDVIGRPLFEVRPDIRADAEPIHEQVYRTGKRFKAEEVPIKITTDGIAETRYFNVVIDPMFNTAAEIVGQLASSIEVTEQVISRKKVEDSENYLRMAMEGGDLGTYDFYPQTGKLVWSAKTKELFGLPPNADVNYDTFLQGLHPDDKDRSHAITQRALKPENGGYYENEYRTIGIMDGKLRWVRSKGKITFDQNGKAVRFTGVTQDITERKRTEEVIRASEDRYQTFIRQSTEGIWRFEVDQPISIDLPADQQIDLFFEYAYLAECNDAMAQMYGFSKAEELVGKRLNQFFPRDKDTEDYLNYFVRSDYRVRDTESREMDKDGSTVYFMNNLVGIVEKGKLIRAWGTQRNVTAQKAAELQLKASEVRFRALVTATSDVVYRMSPDWTEMRNLEGRGFLSDTGEPIRDWLKKYIHPRDQQRVTIAINEAIRTKKIFELEHQVLRADGTLGWTFSRAIPIFDNNGEIIEWFGAASDITARKQAEEELKAAREETESRKRLYETVTSSTPDLIYVFDLNYRFTYANEALLQMWGKTWDEAVGKSLLENGYEPWHAEMHEREIDQVVATKKPIRGEVSFPHATLGKRIYDYIFAPVINKKGEVEAIAGTTRDITDLKAAQEVLRKSREELEALVIERTRELQRSNEDLQQFAHVASHDLKEPVRKVMTFSNRLKEALGKNRSEEIDAYLSKIESSTIRMYSMIDGVLLYSSLNALEQTKEEIDLNELIQSVKADLEVPITKKQAEINYSGLPSVPGSSILIYQLFYNLINNSLKFSKSELKPLINIREHTVSADDLKQFGLNPGRKYVKIVVQDNGIGFRNQQAASIFTTFTRLHSKDRYEGTGLGLALCKKIAERHGGVIFAEGKENEGAVFTILLPKS